MFYKLSNKRKMEEKNKKFQEKKSCKQVKIVSLCENKNIKAEKHNNFNEFLSCPIMRRWKNAKFIFTNFFTERRSFSFSFMSHCHPYSLYFKEQKMKIKRKCKLRSEDR
jgi:hypothetical protein